MSKALCFLLLLFFPTFVGAQESPTATPAITESATPEASASPFKLGEIPLELEKARSELELVLENIPELDSHVDLEALENRPEPSTENLALEKLRQLVDEWSRVEKEGAAEEAELKDYIARLGRQLEQLQELRDAWQATLSQPDLPAELKVRVQGLLLDYARTDKRISRLRSNAIVRLTRLARQETRVRDTLKDLTTARQRAQQRLLSNRQSAIWELDPRADFAGAPEKLGASLHSQLSELKDYVPNHGELFVLHAAILMSFFLALRWARHKVEPWVAREPTLQRSAAAFREPYWSALLLAVMLNRLIYPQAPSTLRVIFGAMALLPAAILLRRLLDAALLPLLNLLLCLFFADQLRILMSSHTMLARLLFNVELIGGLVCLWWVRPKAGSAARSGLLSFVAGGCVVVLVLALLVSNIGYVDLGYLLANAILNSSYLAMFLFALLAILEGLFMLALRLPPLSLLRSVNQHRPLWRRGARRLISVSATALWVFSLLRSLGIFETLSHWAHSAGQWGLHLGALDIRLGGILYLVVALWLAQLLSRLLRFLLEEDVFPHSRLDSGLTYTLSTLLHYTLLTMGLLAGLATLGLDSTKFLVVFGALGVGIGFGLQNIVNNFVSGLILLFERPVKVGDVIDITGQQGILKSIGLRASVIRTLEGSELIIPNGDMLAKQVTNWTLSDPTRRLSIDVGVAYGTDPRKLSALVTQVLLEHPDVLPQPRPELLFLNLGDSSLDFQARAWNSKYDEWPRIRSELLTNIYEALNAAGIEIPFPQRVLHQATDASEPPPAPAD